MLRKKIKEFDLKILGVGLIFLTLINFSCQRDDICPDSTAITPLLRISFFDFENPEVPKPPTNLRVKATNMDSIFLNRVNLSEISIPLKTDVDITEYEFILNAQVTTEADSVSTSNTDKIKFTYARNEIYINRACSYKVNYIDLRIAPQPLDEDTNRWIKNIVVEEENIENETNTHIFIYH
jgi:hypothetical protein